MIIFMAVFCAWLLGYIITSIDATRLQVPIVRAFGDRLNAGKGQLEPAMKALEYDAFVRLTQREASPYIFFWPAYWLKLRTRLKRQLAAATAT